MERLKTYVQAAHLSLTDQEAKHVFAGAKALIELAEAVPETAMIDTPQFTREVHELRADTVDQQDVRPEDFAPATQDGFIRVPRVLD